MKRPITMKIIGLISFQHLQNLGSHNIFMHIIIQLVIQKNLFIFFFLSFTQNLSFFF